ncbi:hypothetical protein BKA62DRAFT_686592 [Auriculariales sp. MPI-PUGE-AT-0066]|nr:hypothetical protein BKA62DRAFT_686592 [Auriculariales sp. MPI-PUGE-AT-0066]
MEELDSLFGSPTTPTLVLPSGGRLSSTASEHAGLGHPTTGSSLGIENVGTIALPGLHRVIEPVITNSSSTASLSEPPSRPSRKRKRGTEASQTRAATQEQGQQLRRSSRGTRPHALEATSTAPGDARSHGRVSQVVTPVDSSRASTPGTTKGARGRRKELQIINPPHTPSNYESHRTVLDRLQSDRDFIIVLRLLLANASQARNQHLPFKSRESLPGVAAPWSSQRDIVVDPGYVPPQTRKRRKLQTVPAGAQLWDVPYPFAPGEGPRDYETHWRAKRGELLVKALVRIIENVLKEYKRDGAIPQSSGSVRGPLQVAEQNMQFSLDHGPDKPVTSFAGQQTPQQPMNLTASVNQWLDSLSNDPTLPFDLVPTELPVTDDGFFERLFGADLPGDFGMDLFQDLFMPTIAPPPNANLALDLSMFDLQTPSPLPTQTGGLSSKSYALPFEPVTCATGIQQPVNGPATSENATVTGFASTPALTSSASTSTAPTVFGADEDLSLPIDLSAWPQVATQQSDAPSTLPVDHGTLQSLIDSLLSSFPPTLETTVPSMNLDILATMAASQQHLPQLSPHAPSLEHTLTAAPQSLSLVPLPSVPAPKPRKARQPRLKEQSSQQSVQQPQPQASASLIEWRLDDLSTFTAAPAGAVPLGRSKSRKATASVDEWVTTKVERKSELLERAATHRARLQAEMARICEEMWGCTIETSVVQFLKKDRGLAGAA